MTAVRRRSLGDRLEVALAPCVGVEPLARALFAAIAPDVPFALACLAPTDPANGLITRAYKSHPLPVGDEEFAAAEYGEPDVNQFAEVARRPVPVAVLSIDTGGRLELCRRFAEFMAPAFGFTDELRLAFRAQGTTWGVLALYRGPGEPPFSAGEGRRLAAVGELVGREIRRALFAGGTHAEAGGEGPAVIIVDSDDRVSDLTAPARDRIADLGGYDHGALPASVLALVARARASREPVTTRAPGGSGRWLVMRAITLEGAGVVITIGTAARHEIGLMTLAARGLTAREQEVAGLVLRGASTRVIAQTLFLSPHTVQDHLKSIFTKLGVSSRREMIARLVLT